jgi:hypothetical protein
MEQRQQQKLMRGTSNHREHLAWKLLERLRLNPKEMGLEFLGVHLVFSRQYRISFRNFYKFQLDYDFSKMLLGHSRKGKNHQLGRLDLGIYR